MERILDPKLKIRRVYLIMSLLKINDLKCYYQNDISTVKAVDGVSFEINEERSWALWENQEVARPLLPLE
jgi:hypothetical protein